MNIDAIIDEYSVLANYNGPFKSHYTDEEIAFLVSEIQRMKLANMRAKRNQLLAETDHMLLGDVWNKLSNKKQNDIIAYRQALRDLPATVTDLDNVIYPEKP